MELTPSADGLNRITTPTGDLWFSTEGIVQAASRGARTLTGATFSPGAVCAHTHLYSGLAPLGMPAAEPKPKNFLQILQRVWWRLDRALDERALRAAARLYVAESLLSGTTTLIDHHESPHLIEGSLDILADACDHLGIRALLCYGATERNQGYEEGLRGLAECERFLKSRQTPSLKGMIALHASFTVSDKLIRHAGDLARANETVLHVHLAEDAADVTDAQERGYAGPLARLVALGAMPAGSIMAHGVHLTVAEVEELAHLGGWLVHNPRSNNGNGVGYAEHLAATSRVALGTDGFPAKMAEEMIAVREGPSVAQLRLDTGRKIAAERFGRDFGLDEGGVADVVVYHGDGSVAHVVVDGRIVVENGRLQTGDIEEIRNEARDAAQSLWVRMGEF